MFSREVPNFYYAPDFRDAIHPNSNESEPPKEKSLKFYIGWITVSGPPGSGNTSSAKEFAEKNGIKFFGAGQLMRAILAERGQRVLGYASRSPEIDREVDRKEAEVIRNATPENPIVVEGKAAQVISYEEVKKAKKEGRYIAPGVSVVFSADPTIKAKRVKARENLDMNLSQVETFNEIRVTRDTKRYGQLHCPIKHVSNLYDPEATYPDGTPLYRYHIVTSKEIVQEDGTIKVIDKPYEEIINELSVRLVEDGLAEWKEIGKEETAQNIDISSSGVIFEKP